MLKSYYAEFFTATILNWQKLLHDDNLKQIIVDSLQWLVKEKRCTVYAFVIMLNHMHLLWRITEGLEREIVQGALLSFTAHTFKKHLKQNASLLKNFYVDAKDRSYQFWQREPFFPAMSLSLDLCAGRTLWFIIQTIGLSSLYFAS